MLEPALILFFPALMAYAAASDLLSMTISNKISLALMAGFMVFALWMGLGTMTIAWHWAMFAVVLVAGFTLFAFGVIGGGDAKLAAAIGAALGFPGVLPALFFAALAGGVLAAIAGLRGQREVAYGPAFAAGVAMALVVR